MKKTEQINLNTNQILTWQQAYDWQKLETPKYVMFGNFPNTKEGKEFFKPFIQAGYILKDHLKFAGAFRLTEKGVMKFEELKTHFN